MQPKFRTIFFVVVLLTYTAVGGGNFAGAAETGGHLFGSAAKRDIAPPKELMPKLLGIMPGNSFERVEDGLFVRVIALGNGKETALFVDYELDQAPFPAETLKKIHEKNGIAEENIFLLGNHGHEAPAIGVRLGEPYRNQMREKPEYKAATVEYEQQVFKATDEAVDEALKTMRPVRIGYGSGESQINVRANNRPNPVMPLDTTLFVLKIEDLKGAPIAFLLNYSSHNNAVKVDGVITADLEGCISHLMEDRFPGSVAIWSLSAHGDLMARSDYWNVPVPIAAPAFAEPESAMNDAFRRMRILSLRQFEDALRILSHLKCKEDAGAVISSAVDFVEVPTYPVIENQDGSISYMGGTATLSAEARKNATGRAADTIRQNLSGPGLPYRVRLHMTRVGQLAFIGVGGKLYNSYKLKIREMAPLDLETVVFSQDSSALSTVTYILDARALRLAARNALPGDNNPLVRPGSVEEEMMKTAKNLFAKIGNPAN